MPFDWQQVDRERSEIANRAISVTSGGAALLQTMVNKTVQQVSIREMGIQSTLPRKPGSGDKAYINRRAPGSSGGEWLPDTTDPTEEVGTYTQSGDSGGSPNFKYQTLVARGKVTRKVQATGRTYGNILAEELVGDAEDFADELEFGLLQGIKALAPNQIDGFLTLVMYTSSQVVANTSATGGGAFLLAKLDAAIDKVKGAAAREDLIIVGSFAGLQKVNSALQAQQRFNDVTNIAAGFRVRTYDGIPMVTSTRMPDAMVWDGTSRVTAFTGGATTGLLILNTRFAWIEDLTPLTVMPLAKASSQYDQYDMFEDTVGVLANPLGGALLAGIAV